MDGELVDADMTCEIHHPEDSACAWDCLGKPGVRNQPAPHGTRPEPKMAAPKARRKPLLDDLAGVVHDLSTSSQRFARSLSRLPIELRRETVRELTEAGLSTRAIAPVVAVSQQQVVRDGQVTPNVSPAPETPETPETPDVGEADAGTEGTPDGVPTRAART